MIRSILSLSLAALARAEWDSCAQPSLVSATLDQGYGRSYGMASKLVGTDLYVGGYMWGNMTLTGPAGTELTHYGRPGAQNVDMFVYKVNAAGEPTGKFTVPTGGVGYWSPYVTAITHLAGDAGIVIGGNFKGNLTFDKADGTSQTIFAEAPGRRDYGVFVAKISNAAFAANKVDWVTHLAPTASGANSRRLSKLATDSDGHVIAAGYESGNLGNIAKVSHVDGTIAYDHTWASIEEIVGVDAGAEGVYFTAMIEGKDVQIPTTADAAGPFLPTVTSAEDGESASTVVAKLSTAGYPVWVKVLGRGEGKAIAVHTNAGTDSIYAVGQAQGAYASITGDAGGFVVRLANNGDVTWIKDMPYLSLIATNAAGTAVFAAHYFDDKLTFGSGADTLELLPHGDLGALSHGNPAAGDDMAVIKLDAADGSGHWGMAFGGDADERVYGMEVDAAGDLWLTGRADSPSITVNGAPVNLMNHISNGAPTQERTMAVLKIGAAGTTPSCLTCNAGQTTKTATLAAGKCMINNMCFNDGQASPFQSCFVCDASAAAAGNPMKNGPKAWSGPAATHCYMNDVCYPPGTVAPPYRNYNGASECEKCDIAVSTTSFSLTEGYLLDTAFARIEKDGHGRGTNINDYGMVFEDSSNGCQMVPAIDLTSPSADVTAASSMVTASAAVLAAADIAAKKTAFTGSVLDVAGDAKNMFMAAADSTGFAAGKSTHYRKAVMDKAMDALHAHAAIAKLTGGMGAEADSWKQAYVHFHQIPRATAHARCPNFETCLNYGNAVASVKVQQNLAAGHLALTQSSGANVPLARAEALEVINHIRLIYYQAALYEAHMMDTTTGNTKLQHQGHAHAYFSIIKPTLEATHPDEAAAVHAILTADAPPSFGYCALHPLLAANIYNSTTGDHGHLTENDFGALTAASGVTCTFPPPPPSSPPPSTAAALGLDKLSDGAIAGIAAGAAVLGLCLLVLLFLVCKSKSTGKPVFYCLEDDKGPKTDYKADNKGKV